MTERLYYTRFLPARVRRGRRRARRRTRGRPRSSSTGRRSIRPPAASRSTSGRSSGAQVLDVVDTDDGRILHVVDRAPDGDARQRDDRLDAALRSHAAAHRAARAVGGVRSAAEGADRELPSRRRLLDDRPGARAVAGRDRAGRGRGQPRRLGGPAGRRSASPGRRRSRRCRSARSPSARGRCA